MCAATRPRAIRIIARISPGCGTSFTSGASIVCAGSGGSRTGTRVSALITSVHDGKRGARAGYTQLVYACCQCNAAKQAAADVLDPWVEPFGRHVQVAADGTIHGRTPQGHALIQICRLDRPKLTVFRQGMLHLWHDLRERPGSEAAALRQRFFGAPENLPHLAALRPPGGNTRPQGIAESAYARQQRGESCPLA